MFSFAAILPDMKPAGSVAFTVKVDPHRFPAELWPKFQEATRARGEIPVDVLRRLIEQYIADTKGRTP